MEKYNLLPEQLLYEGTISEASLFSPGQLNEDIILATHQPGYWQKLKNLSLSRKEERRTGFPLSDALIIRERTIMQGTIDAALYALQYGIGMNIAGGTHHAYSDRGEGFCLLNDMALAANYLLSKKLVNKVLIIDLDVHQGNGTAEIFRNQDSVFTFSMHGEKNYPLHKESSDLDIALPDKTGDEAYLEILEDTLEKLFQQEEPDFVCFQSGVDVLATDKLGRLGLSIQGCRRRDALVLSLCKEAKVPVVVAMGGGYSERIAHIVEAHANTFRLAQEIFF